MGNTFYFDNDCRLCIRLATWLRRITFSLDILPLEHPSPHVIAEISHKQYVANDAIGHALRHHGRWGWVRLAGLTFHGPVQRYLYYQVAKHRSPVCRLST